MSLQFGEPRHAFAVDLPAYITAASDRQFRGLSLSDRDPVSYAGIDACLTSSVFAGAWASMVADPSRLNVELNLHRGYTNELAGIEMFLKPRGVFAAARRTGAD